MTEPSRRIPPYSQEAEQNVLGCLLLDSEAFEPVQKLITSEMFYSKANKQVFEALQTVFMNGLPVDIISVSEQMKKDKTLNSSGGMEYLTKITSQVVSISSVEYYASLIFDKFILRSLISISGEIYDTAYNDNSDAKAVLEVAQQKLFNLSEAQDTDGVKKISDLVLDRLKYFRFISKEKIFPNRIETGFADIDRIILGFNPGDFVLIAARPSVGKSTLAMNMAQNMAIRNKKNVLFLSLEMSNEQLTDRIIASEARISNTKLQKGEIDQSDWSKVTATAGTIHEAKIFIDDSSSVTVADIRSKCRRFKNNENLDIVFIDYLQLIGSAVKKENRQQEVTEISRQLKILAKDMKIPVVALSQLSREAEKRKDNKPQLSDLRESGAIEQDADIVMFLYRPAQMGKAASTQLVDLVVAKNRNGQIGNAQLVWQDQIVKFDTLQK